MGQEAEASIGSCQFTPAARAEYEPSERMPVLFDPLSVFLCKPPCVGSAMVNMAPAKGVGLTPWQSLWEYPPSPVEAEGWPEGKLWSWPWSWGVPAQLSR